MSISRLLTIHCDTCGHWIDAISGDTATETRRKLHEDGWRVLPGSQDICDECRAGNTVL